jgi:hypothetical protein
MEPKRSDFNDFDYFRIPEIIRIFLFVQANLCKALPNLWYRTVTRLSNYFAISLRLQ